MKKAITLTLLCFCTIGGEETEKVATIEETLPVQEIEEEITFEEGLLSFAQCMSCLLYTSPSPRDRTRSRMPSSA